MKLFPDNPDRRLHPDELKRIKKRSKLQGDAPLIECELEVVRRHADRAREQLSHGKLYTNSDGRSAFPFVKRST